MKIRTATCTVLALLLAACAAGPPPDTATPDAAEPSTAPRFTWAGYEIVGHEHHEREEIVALLPDLAGRPFDGDEEMRLRCGERLEEGLAVASAECSWVFFLDGDTYLLVEIVARGEEERTRFADAPTEQVPLADERVVATFDALMEQMQASFQAGENVGENTDAGYLDYRQPEMHGHVEELRRQVPPYRENLLRVLALDADVRDRTRAAWLLNWAGDEAASIAVAHRHLDDPNGVVRNDVSRFMLHYLDEVESQQTLRAVVDSLAVQLTRSSHGDRNKALYALQVVLDAHPQMAPWVEQQAGEWIDRIAEQSILDNVGGVARELRQRLAEKH